MRHRWRTSNSAVADPIVWSCLLLFLCTLAFTDHDSFPVCQVTRKTVALHSTILVKFCWEKRVAVEALLLVMAPFRTEAVLTVLHRNDPPWPRLDSAVSNSPPRATRSCALCNDQILEWSWKLNAWTSQMWPLTRYRSRKRARTQWARLPLILKRNLKLLLRGGGFIGNGEPPPPPPCTRLIGKTQQT